MVETRQYSPAPDLLPQTNHQIQLALGIVADRFRLSKDLPTERKINSILVRDTAYHILSARGLEVLEISSLLCTNPEAIGIGLNRFYKRRQSDFRFKSLADEIDKQIELIWPIDPVIKNPTTQQVLNLAQETYSIPISAIRGKTRSAMVTEPRVVTMYLLRKAGFSLKEIGFTLGKRNHSTIISGLKKINKLKEADPEFTEKLSGLEDKIDFFREKQNPAL